MAPGALLGTFTLGACRKTPVMMGTEGLSVYIPVFCAAVGEVLELGSALSLLCLGKTHLLHI